MGTICCGSRLMSEMGVHKSNFREQISKMVNSQSPFVIQAWNEKTYGGSTLLNRNKLENPLDDSIANMEIEYLFGGGFYHFKDLEGHEGQYDVWMLVSSIDDYDIL